MSYTTSNLTVTASFPYLNSPTILLRSTLSCILHHHGVQNHYCCNPFQLGQNRCSYNSFQLVQNQCCCNPFKLVQDQCCCNLVGLRCFQEFLVPLVWRGHFVVVPSEGHGITHGSDADLRRFDGSAMQWTRAWSSGCEAYVGVLLR